MVLPKRSLDHGIRFFLFFTALIVFFFAAARIFWFSSVSIRPIWGATFSSLYAEQLGLDWRETYIAVLDELHIQKLRIPVYWSEVEIKQGVYDWKSIDWMLDEAEKRGVKVTLVTGRKVPRWPECFIPDWAERMESSQAQHALLNTIETTVKRYQKRSVVERWQVENEPFFPFGICPEPDFALFQKEVRLVENLDYRPLVVTVSGELEPWIPPAISVNMLGISMYRVTWNSWYGYGLYAAVTDFYRIRAMILHLFGRQTFISELQVEPWLRKPLSEMSREEKRQAFDSHQLEQNMRFASRAEFSEVYLWGVEWWFAEKQQGNSELWEAGKKEIESNFGQ
ncbi:MAG: hypothetical protein UU48_C0007G0024 [Candidatus Uhrbacteria bacterium GW2011_GWF2_41_16]|uniref:GH10 domain-containing protein n=2 Tax=Candidatus Uhriibacteriota TaxID=1752732 RepID=A0A0G0VDZ3_9BACT|nr:MAG: hypothetical protein UU35_C0005G0017 [Candidatus Uhrbacteria bacterium GW2011_GWC2_41_11]KKR97891.1 MAG: hypothetical protein UU48_C0007G0024 [Candidatus Uhrbacteria bacterium GW2011_GWF2_41_16]HBO99576.1 hypothetical protein [Candidatus Uhrbacteria bacterium]